MIFPATLAPENIISSIYLFILSLDPISYCRFKNLNVYIF
jgi:hypothetical protein